MNDSFIKAYLKIINESSGDSINDNSSADEIKAYFAGKKIKAKNEELTIKEIRINPKNQQIMTIFEKGHPMFFKDVKEIKSKLISEQTDMRVNSTNPEYKGPRQITCSITDPRDLAVNNEMTYEEFYQDLQNMVKAFKGMRIQVLSTQGSMWGSDRYVDIGFCADIRTIAEFLKLPTIGANLDSDVASIIYDLSDGSLFPSDVDEDPIGILSECPSVRIVDIDDHDYYDDIRNHNSNVEEFFLNEDYLNEAKEYLGDTNNDTDI